MDTPSGLDTSMRAIIRGILASSIPVVSYVSPSAPRAASASIFILYTSHFAAMAPGTNTGAATPVQIGGIAPTPDRDQPKKSANLMETKAVNDAAAFIRSLAELRGRNAGWAEKAVREAASLSATTALCTHVIDIEAREIANLLRQLHGTKVRIGGVALIVLGKHEPDEMLAKRDKLNNDVQEILDNQIATWGIKVTNVEIKQIDITETMIRAVARQAEVERERRAKIINAEGERQAAQQLLEAPVILGERPEAMQLRYLGSLNFIAGDKNSTVAFPFPIEFAQWLKKPPTS